MSSKRVIKIQINKKNSDMLGIASKPEKEIVHEFFWHLSLTQTDEFWATYLRQIAYGDLPKNFSIRDRLLTIRGVKELYKFAIPEFTEESGVQMIKFLREKAYVISPAERDMMTSESRICEVQSKWSEFRREPEKRKALMVFCDEMSEEMGFTKRQTERLRTVLELALASRQLSPKNVIVEDGKIIEIVGLDFINGFAFMEAEPKPTKKVSTFSVLDTREGCEVNLDLLWEKCKKEREFIEDGLRRNRN